jgi:sialate O-acetylesterase
VVVLFLLKIIINKKKRKMKSTFNFRIKVYQLLLLVILLQWNSIAIANIRLPKFFSDNVVLQREHTIPVWGWADAKEKITVQLNKQTKTITTGKDGKWRIDLAAEAAGGPYILIIKGKNTITINNVLIGDVWVCSGQSNMEMPIGSWGFINNFKEEIAAANYPNIRQFLVPKQTAVQPQTELSDGDWKICNPENAAMFSAVAYFFGRELNKELNIPVGLINTTWGGTQVESWTSRQAFENSDEFNTMISGMQNVNIDELIKIKKENTKKKIEQLQGAAVPDKTEIATWKNKDFDDAGWSSLTIPGLWEQQGLEDIDGFIWFRKTIDISAEEAGKAATLELAMIDDNDETFLNGEKIGSTTGYNVKRNYTIPAGVLKQGRNTIAVRVEDTGGGGGIYGDATDIKISIGSNEKSLAGNWKVRIEAVTTASSGIGPNSYPTLLYNAMIHPLLPYAIKGAIWYQGEANAGRAYQYRKAFPLMINDWRNQWKQGDFPFYFVQLATFNSNNGNSEKGSDWAELREAQALTLSLPNTGMAVTTDIGDAKDIHPKNKQDVGKRLAAIALNKTYGKNIVAGGPVYQSFKTEGNKIIVSFTNVGGGLMAKDKYGYLKGFEIAGADQRFHYAIAHIEGDNVVVSSNEVPNPVAVRFGWADDAGDNNLYNKEGFPAPPFRTDNWKGITEKVKFSF